MKLNKYILGACILIILFLAIAFWPKAEEKSQEQYDTQEKEQVETLNRTTSGVGLDYNANSENENPAIEAIDITDSF